MKNSIKAAVAAILAVSGGAVSAATLPSTDNDTTDGWLNIAGATSTDPVLFEVAVDSGVGLCDTSTTIEVYTTESSLQGPASGAPTNFAIACHTSNTTITGAYSSGNIVLRKYSGSSGSGLSNISTASGGPTVLASSTTADRYWVDVVSCRTAVSPTTFAAGTLPGFPNASSVNVYVGCGYTDTSTNPNVTAAGRIPRAGLSDEEPAQFIALLNPVSGSFALSSAQAAGIKGLPGLAVGWGPVVNTPLYVALQKMQNLDGTTCAYSYTPTPSTYTTSADTSGGTVVSPSSPVHLSASSTLSSQTAACVPNLSRSILTAIYLGKITNTSQLYGNPSGDTGAAPTFEAATGEPLNQDIFVCRRAYNSGTQVAFQTYFLRQNCGTGGQGTVTRQFVPTDGATDGGANWVNGNQDRVFAGTGTTDVLACLNYHASVGQFAVGISSTEYVPGSSDSWRFVRYDGNVPSLENIVAGVTDFFTEDSWNLPTTWSPTTLPGVKAALFGASTPTGGVVYASLQNASIIKFALQNQIWGWGGVLQIPTAAPTGTPQGYASLHSSIQSSPVNTQTHKATYSSAAAPANCNPPMLGGSAMVPESR